jgi:Fe-S oxidoreductase
VLGFLQDFIAMMAFFGILTFVWIRLRNAPKDLGRRSRFFGSHLSGAWITLFMIFNVIWTMFLFRGSSSALGNLPYTNGAFVSIGVGKVLNGLPHGGLEFLEGVGLLLHIGVMLVFLVFVLNSKHLHIFVAPLNVLFGRRPDALGAVKPLISDGRPGTLDDIEDMDEDTTLGVGSIGDFTWKGLLDFTTCTECGRCQSQCPAWNTEQPLSPTLLIMNLRDHALASAPALLSADGSGVPEEAKKESERPLIGDESMYGVIDPDVLWSCTTCGACVNQCPVDIEHVDHIVDMRRYQVLVENNFPAELNQLFKGLEGKGNPWNMSASARMDWAKGLEFDVPVVGETLESMESVDWLFWVGCAGAYEDRAKKTTRAVAELLNLAGVSFGVLGNGETCTGDPARRAGNEFVYQGLAQQNVDTLTEHQVKQVVTTCAHCFNTLKNEYRDFGLELEVVHHTQLLNRLVREGRLTPVPESAGGAGAAKRTITYHDPCYLGRHNKVYTPPRELLQVLPGASYVEMERSGERSFCCGAGGARVWMEENLGERINTNRTKEAVATGADQIAVGCPFCRVMLSAGLAAEQASGAAREEVEVLDVAQLLLASVKGVSATRTVAGAAAAPAAATSTEVPAEEVRAEEVRAEPEPGDDTQTEETVTETADVGPAAKASGGGSLFDLGPDDGADEGADEGDRPSAREPEATAPAEPEPEEPAAPTPTEQPLAENGSLFDIAAHEASAAPDQGADDTETSSAREPEATAPAEPEPEEPAAPTPTEQPLAESGSLFDIAAPEASDKGDDEAEGPSAREPEATAAAEPEPEEPAAPAPAEEPLAESGSLFDIAAPEASAEPEKAPEPEKSEREEAPEPAAEPEPRAPVGDNHPTGADISALATAASADEETDAAPAPEATPEPAPEPEPDDTADEKKADTPAPRTDVDINESGSLFDL